MNLIQINRAVDPGYDSCSAGEELRNRFFWQDKEGPPGSERWERGCYRTFELRPEVKKLPDQAVVELTWGVRGSGNVWRRAVLEGIEMRYFWDGDGFLVFLFPDGMALINDDCKKPHHWCYDNFLEWLEHFNDVYNY